MDANVFAEQIFAFECLVAFRTTVFHRVVDNVLLRVQPQIVLRFKCFVAIFAYVRPIVRMHDLVQFQSRRIVKHSTAFIAFICARTICVMRGHVMLDVRLLPEQFATDWARMLFGSRMRLHVFVFVTIVAKSSIANLTLEWFLARMDAHMFD